MLFHSFAFLVFLPIFAAAYWATRGRARLWVMFLASLVFYGWWDWRFIFLLLISAVVDYSIGIAMENQQDERRRKRLLFFSVAVNLCFLGFFKYFNYFADSAARLSQSLGLAVTYNALNIVLPVGISFYVFKTMSYTIDVYRRTQQAERDLLKFCTFVVFFPELVAGPIVRASLMLPQMKKDHPFDFERMVSGLTLVAAGYVRKVVVADSIAPLVDFRFAAPEAHTALSLLIGVYLYAFQIYCDFSGYSNIAIGLARIFGFDFGINFDRPYFSRSFSEFWSRWHISLSSWLRDYLYIPLGGNRGGTLFTYRNLLITMILGGLWHGANWTFVVWGALHGTYLIAQRVIGPVYQRFVRWLRIPAMVSNAFLVLFVFHLTCLAWIFFRAPTLAMAWDFIARIASMRALELAALPDKLPIAKVVVIIAFLLLFEAVRGWWKPAEASHAFLRWRLAFIAGCVWAMLFFGSFSGNTFIYFQF